jgi:hypothetical protein
VNWKQGDDVVVHPSVPTEDARKLFNNLVEHKVSASRFHYLEVHADKLMPGSITSGRRRSLHKRVNEKVRLYGLVCRCTISTMQRVVVFPWQHEPCRPVGAVEAIKNI